MPRTSLRTAFPFLVAGLTTLAGVLPAEKAEALSPYLVVPAASVAEATAAYRYANMTASEALAELDTRKIPYTLADPIDGVVAPVRLTGKLHGVHIHSSIPESQRATSVYEVLDARLALALDDFAKVLSRHDIEEVVHYSLYRPNVPREDHDLKEAKNPAVAKTGAADVKTGAPVAKTGAADVKTGAPVAKTGAPVAKTGAPVAKTGAPVAKTGAPVAKTGAPVAKTGAPVAKTGAPVAKTGAPVAKTGAPVAKTGAPVSRVAAALPPLPAGKAFPSVPGKGQPAAGHGAKQKTPVAEKKVAASPPSAAPSTKPGPASAAGRTSAATTGRGVGPRAATPQKIGAATPARARTGTGTKVDASAPSAPAPAVVAAKATAHSHAHAHSHGAPATRQTWAAPGTRHPAGLAIDVAMLKKRDGQWISVATHFRGRIGDKTCGDGVRTADTPEARELRSIVCESNDLGVFTYVLTPNYNAAHVDHFHMEIRPQVKWFLYQ